MTRAARELPDELCYEEKASLMRRVRALRESRVASRDICCTLVSYPPSERDATYSSGPPWERVRFLDRTSPIPGITPVVSGSRIPISDSAASLPNQSGMREICAISNSLECVRSSTVVQGSVPPWFATPSPMLQELCLCSDTTLATRIRSSPSKPKTNTVQEEDELPNVSKESIGIASIVPGSVPTPSQFVNDSETNNRTESNQEQLAYSNSTPQTVISPPLIPPIEVPRASKIQEDKNAKVGEMLGFILDRTSVISPEPPRPTTSPSDWNALRNSCEILKCNFEKVCAGQEGLPAPPSQIDVSALRDSVEILKHILHRASTIAIDGSPSRSSSASESGTQSDAKHNSHAILGHILDKIVPSSESRTSQNIAPNTNALRVSYAIFNEILDGVASAAYALPSESGTQLDAKLSSHATFGHILDKIVSSSSESGTLQNIVPKTNALRDSYAIFNEILDGVTSASYALPPETLRIESATNETSDSSGLPDSEPRRDFTTPDRGGSPGSTTSPNYQDSQTSQNAQIFSEDSPSPVDEPCCLLTCPEDCPPLCPVGQPCSSDPPNEDMVPVCKIQSCKGPDNCTLFNATGALYKSPIVQDLITQPTQTSGTVVYNPQASKIDSKRSQQQGSPPKTGCNINNSKSGKGTCKGPRTCRERDSSTQARPATYRRLSSKQTSPPYCATHWTEKVEMGTEISDPVPGAQNAISTGSQTEPVVFCNMRKCGSRYPSEMPDTTPKENVVIKSSQTMTNEAAIITAEQDSNKVSQPRKTCCTLRRTQNANGKNQTTELAAKYTDPAKSATSRIPTLSPRRSSYDDSTNPQNPTNSRSIQHQRNKTFIARCSPNRFSPSRFPDQMHSGSNPATYHRGPGSCDVGVCTDHNLCSTSSASAEDPATRRPFNISNGISNVGNASWNRSPVLNTPNIPMICMPLPVPVPVPVPCSCNRFGARYLPPTHTSQDLGNINAVTTPAISALPPNSKDNKTLESQRESSAPKPKSIEVRHVTVATSPRYRRKFSARKKNAHPIILSQTIQRSEPEHRVAQCIQKLTEIISFDEKDNALSVQEESHNAGMEAQSVETDATNVNSDIEDDEVINTGHDVDKDVCSISTNNPHPINERNNDDTDDGIDQVDIDEFGNVDSIETDALAPTLIIEETSELGEDATVDSTIVRQNHRGLYRCGNELDNRDDLVHQLESKKSIELQVEAVLRETAQPLRIVIAPKDATEVNTEEKIEKDLEIQPELNAPETHEDATRLCEGTIIKQPDDTATAAAASESKLPPSKPAEHPKSPQKTISSPKRSSTRLFNSNVRKSSQRPAHPSNQKNRPTARKSSTHIKHECCSPCPKSPPATIDPFLFMSVKDAPSSIPSSRADKKSTSNSTIRHRQTAGSRVSSPELATGSRCSRSPRVITPRECEARALAAVEKRSWSRLTRTGRDALSRAVREHKDSEETPEHSDQGAAVNESGASENEGQGLCVFSAPVHFGSPSPSPTRALYRPPPTGNRLTHTSSINFKDDSASTRSRAPSRTGKSYVPLNRENIQSEIAAVHLERSVQMQEPPLWKPIPRMYRQQSRLPTKPDYTSMSQRSGSQQSTIQHRDRQTQKSDQISRKQKRPPLLQPRTPKAPSRSGRQSVVSSPDVRTRTQPSKLSHGGSLLKEPMKMRDAQRRYCEDPRHSSTGGAPHVRAVTRGDPAERPGRRHRTISEAGTSGQSPAQSLKQGTTGTLYRRTTGTRQSITGGPITTPPRPPRLPPNPQAPSISQPVLKLAKAPSAPSLTSISPLSPALPTDASLLAQPAPVPPSPTPSSMPSPTASFSPSITSMPETSPSPSVSPSPSSPSLSPETSPTPSDYCTSISAASKAAKNEPAYKYLMDLMSKNQDDANNPDSRTIFITGASIRTLSYGQAEDREKSWPGNPRPPLSLQKQAAPLQVLPLYSESRAPERDRGASSQRECPAQRASPSPRRPQPTKKEQGMPKNGTRGGVIGGRDASDATIAATGAATIRSPARVLTSVSYSIVKVSQSGPVETIAGAGDHVHLLPRTRHVPTRTQSTPFQAHVPARRDSSISSLDSNPCPGEIPDVIRLSDAHNSAPATFCEAAKEPNLLSRKRYSADDLCIRGPVEVAGPENAAKWASPVASSPRGRRKNRKFLGSRRSMLQALETAVKSAAIA